MTTRGREKRKTILMAIGKRLQSIDGGLNWVLLIPLRAVQREHRKVLGRTIRQRRNKIKVSQEKLAELADLHHNYVGELERGEKAASIDVLVKIAKALRIRVRTLVGRL